MTTPRISTPLRIFLWVCSGLWLGGGVLSFFLFDRYFGMLLLFSFVMLVGLVGLAAAVIWTVERIFVFFHLKFHLEDDVLDKAFWTGVPGSEKPKGTLVLSSKSETASPVDVSQASADPRPVKKRYTPRVDAKPLFTRVWDFLSEPAKQGRMSNLLTLFLLFVLLSGVTALVWLLAGSWVNFVVVGKFVFAIGFPIFLLSLFETGRTILKGLFMFLQVIMCVLDLMSGISGGRGGKFAGGGGGFGGGGASGKW